MIPGEFFLRDEPVELNAGRTAIRIRVDNHGDRPIQVGSHTHFFEVNRHLRFDRARAYGCRLDIAAEQDPPARRQLARDRTRQRADRGERHRPEAQADPQQPQPAQRMEQIAPGEPPGSTP